MENWASPVLSHPKQKPTNDTMGQTLKLLSVVAFAMTANLSLAQGVLTPPTPPGATTPGYTEGPIQSIDLQLDGSIIMNVMGVTVYVPTTAIINSPTRTLTLRQLANRTRLPGRTEPGFIGGTALVNGVVDIATQKFTATDMVVEPAENVLIGVVTSVAPLKILNSEIAFIDDARIPFHLVNEFGFTLAPNPPVEVGALASAEGYYAGGKFQAFLLDLAGDLPLANPATDVNIQRAQSRERTPNARRGDEIKMRGFYHVPNGVTPTIRVFRVDAGVATLLGAAVAVPDLNPKFGVWDFDFVTPPTTNVVLGTAPTQLRVVITATDGTTATTTIEPDLIP
jgi:hypothetical protein